MGDELSAERTHISAVEEIMSDERLSDDGKLNMLAIIDDPKKAEELMEKGWNRIEMEAVLREHLKGGNEFDSDVKSQGVLPGESAEKGSREG